MTCSVRLRASAASVRRALIVLVLLLAAASANAQGTISYRLSFPDRQHRLLDVEATFTDVPAETLQLRMSRTSPGRYALHEFAKNVFDVQVTDADGRELRTSRLNPHQWDVPEHGTTVHVRYRVFGDRADGTYLGIDTTHAHINMPAAIIWARGLELRPISIRFDVPSGSNWRVATQLFPGPDAQTFTAPNLQYLIDSPTEVSDFALRTFTIADGPRTPTFRFAAHHQGTDAELDAFVADVEKIVRESRTVFGEFPAYDTNAYTFIADYLPWANGDGMEHRNSTILTSTGSIASARIDLLDTIAHEFFHCWNVERIRPKTLEPFNLEETNMTGELWLAEGFTSYYAPLVMKRAGLIGATEFAAEMSTMVNRVLTAPGREVRTVEEMSRFAPFVDAAAAIDRTSFDNTFLSYYTWGAAIGLGLDLALRVNSDNRVTLDDFMRALWTRFGKPGGRVVGYVDNPYTPADVKAVLADISGSSAFADDFFSSYIQGREAVDYERLLARAGFVVRPVSPQGYAGALRLQGESAGVRITAATPFGSPAYQAGLDRDDLIVSVGGAAVTSADAFTRVVQARRPGDTLPVVVDRRGQQMTATLTVGVDPRREVVTVEQAGLPLIDAQRQFRDTWLSSQSARNTF